MNNQIKNTIKLNSLLFNYWLKLLTPFSNMQKILNRKPFIEPIIAKKSNDDIFTTHEELKERKQFCDDVKEKIEGRKEYLKNINKDGFYDG